MICDNGPEPAWSTCHQGASDGEVWRSTRWRLLSALSAPRLQRAPVLRCRRVTERGGEAFWSSQVCTSPVTPAEWQRGANGCCYARLPEHLLWVTLLFHCHLAPSDRHERPAILVSPSKPAPDKCHFFPPRADKWFMLPSRCIRSRLD